MPDFVGALDQGTTSTRFMVFDHEGSEVARHQVGHRQLFPRPGWVEHDPVEIVERSREAIDNALTQGHLRPHDLAAIGLTNQRETSVLWDRHTGLPYLNAIVWQDTRSAQVVADLGRTGAAEVVRDKTGLVPATYFSAGKLQWAFENMPEVGAAAKAGTLCFGTVDTWLLWNLTGGPRGGRFATDVTNASRTMLMDLRSLSWDEQLLSVFGVPREILAEICPSSGPFGEAGIGGAAVPVAAVLGDQHAAMVGQVCSHPGEAKSTYGTGNFLMMNTGPGIVRSGHGLLSTVCYQLGHERPAYAIEGPIAVTGAAVQWLRDQLGLITNAAQTEQLAAAVEDTAGAYFVPAFAGLFAPYWRPDARGAIVGLTGAVTKAHLARATLEAICYQTRDVLLAMEEDLGTSIGPLKVDGGITANSFCMQLQADILGRPVCRPAVLETTALGAAYAAGCAVGFWPSLGYLRSLWHEDRRWEPRWTEDRREKAYAGWQRAVQRALDWAGP